MPDNTGYDGARKLLSEYFEQKILVAVACTDTIINGPVLNKNDTTALIKLSAKLTSCLNALSGMHYLNRF